MQNTNNMAEKYRIIQSLKRHYILSEQLDKLIVPFYEDAYNFAMTQMNVHDTTNNKQFVFLAGQA